MIRTFSTYSKGGTSLSKVFGLIARFSEDLDLSIRRDYLGAVGENDPEQEGISGTRRGRRVEALRERCRLAVRAEMLPALQTSFTARLGAATGASAWRLDLDPGEEGTLLFASLCGTEAPDFRHGEEVPPGTTST